MLTFEEILEAFRKHLGEDDSVEVVHTRHGYTLIDWDECLEDWASAGNMAGKRVHTINRRTVWNAGDFV